ncbi:hypothetical protein Tco_1294589 [Tanacetum coccineum]
MARKGCALHHWVHDVVFNVSNQLVILTAYMQDSFMESLKSRFGGNEDSKKLQKNLLKQQFETFTIDAKFEVSKKASILVWLIKGSTLKQSTLNRLIQKDILKLSQARCQLLPTVFLTQMKSYVPSLLNKHHAHNLYDEGPAAIDEDAMEEN